MHFITENELRLDYRKAPFQQFILKPKERLTPEGKQFLLDKKIELITRKEMGEDGNQLNVELSKFTCYKEWLFCELFEASILAMDYSITMSQKILEWEKEVREGLSEDFSESLNEVEQPEEIELEMLQLFSRQGKLLIKLKKIESLIHLMQISCPKSNKPLTILIGNINGLRKQLVGVIQ